jgi:hypothetical protein
MRTRSLFAAFFAALAANILSPSLNRATLPALIFLAPCNLATVKHDHTASMKDSDTALVKHTHTRVVKDTLTASVKHRLIKLIQIDST